MLKLAKKLAKKSDHKQHHHAAIITRGGAIVAVGWNKGHEHAEIRALRRCKYRHNLTLYSFRFTKSGKWGEARPCKACQAALEGVKVYHTSADGSLIRQ